MVVALRREILKLSITCGYCFEDRHRRGDGGEQQHDEEHICHEGPAGHVGEDVWEGDEDQRRTAFDIAGEVGVGHRDDEETRQNRYQRIDDDDGDGTFLDILLAGHVRPVCD